MHLSSVYMKYMMNKKYKTFLCAKQFLPGLVKKRYDQMIMIFLADYFLFLWQKE